MRFIDRYASPFGEILLAADAEGLTGLWFAGQKYYALGLSGEAEKKETPILHAVKAWLNVYFAGKDPGKLPPLHFTGTAFQKAVWTALTEIPYGETTTYGALSAKLTAGSASARAVGGAVGRNPISIIVPCHRVLGAGGLLTGYAGGIQRKQALLRLEGILK